MKDNEEVEEEEEEEEEEKARIVTVKLGKVIKVDNERLSERERETTKPS